MPTPLNQRLKLFKRRGMITEGKVLIPTKLVITYRFKTYSSDANTPAPIIRGWGVSVNNPESSIKQAPILLNRNQSAGESTDVLLDSGTVADGDASLETSQTIYFDENYLITNFYAQIKGIEHLIWRELILFYKVDEMADEQMAWLT